MVLVTALPNVMVSHAQGLFEGIIANGNNEFDLTTPFPFFSPSTTIQPSLRLAHDWHPDDYTATFPTAIPENSTVGYVGIIVPKETAIYYFMENFDDFAFLKIDDQIILNDRIWNVPSAGGLLMVKGTKYRFELRLGQQAGRVGPSMSSNESPIRGLFGGGFGIGVSKNENPIFEINSLQVYVYELTDLFDLQPTAPGMSYQGKVTVNGQPFSGIGKFRFSLVSGNGEKYWSNDGAFGAGGLPGSDVPLAVNGGLYSVMLGDITIPGMIRPIQTSMLAHPDVRLRVWFSDGTHDMELLNPDQRLATVPYAFVANTVEDGSITTSKIENGSITAAKIENGSITSGKIKNSSISEGHLSASFNATLVKSETDGAIRWGRGGHLSADQGSSISIGDRLTASIPYIDFQMGPRPAEDFNVRLINFVPGYLTLVGNFAATGSINGSSDRNAKQDFESVDPAAILEKVAALPITSWKYKADNAIRHIGPVAQDFYDAFQVGMDDKHISTVDADGVALAAIKGLHRRLVETTKQVEALEAKNLELQNSIQTIENRLLQLEQRSRSSAPAGFPAAPNER